MIFGKHLNYVWLQQLAFKSDITIRWDTVIIEMSLQPFYTIYTVITFNYFTACITKSLIHGMYNKVTDSWHVYQSHWFMACLPITDSWHVYQSLIHDMYTKVTDSWHVYQSHWFMPCIKVYQSYWFTACELLKMI